LITGFGAVVTGVSSSRRTDAAVKRTEQGALEDRLRDLSLSMRESVRLPGPMIISDPGVTARAGAIGWYRTKPVGRDGDSCCIETFP
jgi:hypothetical protein